jgi:hypothetical protein
MRNYGEHGVLATVLKAYSNTNRRTKSTVTTEVVAKCPDLSTLEDSS